MLENNGVDDLTISADQPFTFASALADRGDYKVTVGTQPNGQTCVVTSGSGTVNGVNVTNVVVGCGQTPSPGSASDGLTVFVSSRSISGADCGDPHAPPNFWRVSADGSGLVPLTRATAAWVDSGGPQWSPDGTTIIFSSNRKLDGSDAANVNYTRNIWRVSADGSGLVPLTRATALEADSGCPQWLPDGSRIIFSSTRKLDGSDAANSTDNIWRMNADGGGLVPLTRATALEARSGCPQWSPDGSRIIFSSNRKLDGTDGANVNYTRNLWRVNADGSDLVPLTRATAMGAHSDNPRWSPDGARIVFESSRSIDGSDVLNKNGIHNVWRVNADGSGLMPLTRATAMGAGTGSGFSLESGSYGLGSPRWSPDGSRIIFSSSRKLDGTDAANDTRNIWRVDADGSSLMPVTRATAMGADSYGPQWSPDGSWISFSSNSSLDGTEGANVNSTYNIWRMSADGSGLKPLTRATAPWAHSYDPQIH